MVGCGDALLGTSTSRHLVPLCLLGGVGPAGHLAYLPLRVERWRCSWKQPAVFGRCQGKEWLGPVFVTVSSRPVLETGSVRQGSEPVQNFIDFGVSLRKL